MKNNIFEDDKNYYADKLAFHNKIGFFLKLFTLGFFQNKNNISKYFQLYNKSKQDADKYYQICSELDKIDDKEIIAVSGVRISKHTFSDIPVINPADYGIDWDVFRVSILERDNYECCETDGYCNGPLQIHHISPLSKGGTNEPINLQTLCYYHHSAKHYHMRRA